MKTNAPLPILAAIFLAFWAAEPVGSAAPLPGYSQAGASPLSGDEARTVARARPDLGAHERSLEARLDVLLADILGVGKARAFVRARSRAPEIAAEPATRPAALWDEIAERIENAPPVLPGYPAPRSLQEEAVRSLMAAAAPSLVFPAGEVLTVTLLVDPSVGREELEPASSAVAEALGLDPARGDLLQVARAPVGSTWRKALRKPDIREAVLTASVYAAAAALLLVLALAILPLTRRRATRRAPDPQVPHRSLARARPESLGFIAPRHAESIVEFLSEQTVGTAVAVLRSVDHETAAAVFRRLPDAAGLAIAKALLLSPPETPAGQPPPPAARRMLSRHLAAVAQGEGLLAEILLRCPERTRGQVLHYLAASAPGQVRSLEKELPTMADLSGADPAVLRRCLSPFSCDEIALSLYDVPDDARNPILSALPAVLRNMVREKAEYLVPDSLEQADRARARILVRWKRIDPMGPPAVHPPEGAVS
ncbi:MAG: FliG C-terminal domain-containing protein [Elusimicrobiota bacterium]